MADVAAGDDEDALNVVAAAADADVAGYGRGHGGGRPYYFVVAVPYDSNLHPF